MNADAHVVPVVHATSGAVIAVDARALSLPEALRLWSWWPDTCLIADWTDDLPLPEVLELARAATADLAEVALRVTDDERAADLHRAGIGVALDLQPGDPVGTWLRRRPTVLLLEPALLLPEAVQAAHAWASLVIARSLRTDAEIDAALEAGVDALAGPAVAPSTRPGRAHVDIDLTGGEVSRDRARRG